MIARVAFALWVAVLLAALGGIATLMIVGVA